MLLVLEIWKSRNSTGKNRNNETGKNKNKKNNNKTG